MKQINKHNLSLSLYNFLNEYYKYNKKPMESYMYNVEQICGKIEILNIEGTVKHTTKHLTEAINGLYQTPNFVYIDH
jgi:hypothetical protein